MRDSAFWIVRASSTPRMNCWESEAASEIRTMARFFQISRSIWLATFQESTRISSASLSNSAFSFGSEGRGAVAGGGVVPGLGGTAVGGGGGDPGVGRAG